MILKVSEGEGPCRATVAVPYGATGIELTSINVPSNAAEFSVEFIAGITHNATAVTIPAQASLEDLVGFLNSIVDGNADKVVDVFFVYNEALFEMFAKTAIVLSEDFAAYIQSTNVNLAANSVFDAVWNLEEKNPVSEYFVEVIAPITGAFVNGEHTLTVGYVDSPRGACKDGYLFRFEDTVHHIRVRVKYRLKSGAEKDAVAPANSRWAVTFRLTKP